MVQHSRRTFAMFAIAAAFALALTTGTVRGLEIGDPAPEFSLPSTAGRDIALADFRGKQWVLIEFYGADFAPT